jgi:hypothetical protein
MKRLALILIALICISFVVADASKAAREGRMFFSKEYSYNKINYILFLNPFVNQSALCFNNYGCREIKLSHNSMNQIIKNQCWKEHSEAIKTYNKSWEFYNLYVNESLSVYQDCIEEWSIQ